MTRILLRASLLVGCLAILPACRARTEERAAAAAQAAAAAPQAAAEAAPQRAAAVPAPLHRTEEFLSPAFHVLKKWRSMEGPSHTQPVALLESERPELLWLTGYRTAVVPEGGDGEVSQEFMCHNNLDLDVERHGRIFGWEQKSPYSARLFSLSQGQFEVRLPEGFGIPVRSDEDIRLSTQVLNHNIENPDFEVRHQVDVDFTRDADLEKPLEPLKMMGIFIMASLEDSDAYYGVQDPGVGHEGSACAMGEAPENTNAGMLYTDEFGRKFTGHWVVKPGREVRQTLVTRQLDLQYDTRIHFIGVHLHPFAESFELRDLTTGESLWTAHARGPARGIGLAEVDHYSSAEGIPLYKDHEYELVSVYDNVSGVDQDAMAVMLLYVHDVEAEVAVRSMRRYRQWTPGRSDPRVASPDREPGRDSQS